MIQVRQRDRRDRAVLAADGEPKVEDSDDPPFDKIEQRRHPLVR